MHPHVLTLDNIGNPVLYCVAHSCERLTAQLLLTLRVHSCALQSEGRIILIIVTFLGYIFILTTIVTFRISSLGLVVVL
jgi:hypothetical protein